MKQSKNFQIFSKGILAENPVLRLVLGTCPTLAVTTSAINGIGMGLSATFVLVCSGAVVSLLRNVIPSRVRIPAYITIIAGLVTIVQMLVKAFLPAIDSALGIFLPLIVVNCIILARAEMFAAKNSLLPAVLDGLGMGIGFTATLTVMGIIRELIGAGTFFSLPITAASSYSEFWLRFPMRWRRAPVRKRWSRSVAATVRSAPPVRCPTPMRPNNPRNRPPRPTV